MERSPAQLVPHQPPWLLIDRVLATGEERVEASKRLSAGDPMTANDGLPELLVLEALAQTAACLVAQTRGAHRGYLVAASNFRFQGRAQIGETLILRAVRRATLGALHRFFGEASVGERVVATGEMTFALEALP